MFKFFKEKLKTAVSKFSKDIDEKGETETKDIEQESSVESLEETEKKDIKKIDEVKEIKKSSKEPITEKKSDEKQPDEKQSYEKKHEGKPIEVKENDKSDITQKPEIIAEEKTLEPKIKKDIPIESKTPTASELLAEIEQEEKQEIKKKPSEKLPEKTTEEKIKEPVLKKIPEENKKDISKKELEAPEKIIKEDFIAKTKEDVSETIIAESEEKSEEDSEEDSEEKPEKKGFLSKIKEKIVTKKITQQQFEDLFWDLELILLENNVAVEVIEKIKNDLKEKLVDNPLQRGSIEQIIMDTLKQAIEDLFNIKKVNVFEMVKEKKPLVICFIGINGSGKTTTIAKVAKMFQKKDLSCVLAAADTFRAAAIDQLQTHADNLGIKLIKHDYGSDAAAVAFDAVKHAQAKGIDIVLIDTAGRMHSNSNLMDEMQKIIRVADPDLKIFVGESITGNDCTEQAKKFNEFIGIDGIILSKADIDEKGGAAISVSYVTGKPILFIGTGQEYDDLAEFDPSLILKTLDL